MTHLMQMRDTGEEALLGLGPCNHRPMWGAVVPPELCITQPWGVRKQSDYI